MSCLLKANQPIMGIPYSPHDCSVDMSGSHLLWCQPHVLRPQWMGPSLAEDRIKWCGGDRRTVTSLSRLKQRKLRIYNMIHHLSHICVHNWRIKSVKPWSWKPGVATCNRLWWAHCRTKLGQLERAGFSRVGAQQADVVLIQGTCCDTVDYSMHWLVLRICTGCLENHSVFV